jgi:tripartite-type tricarboxylate transporter receptor subunit TctC
MRFITIFLVALALSSNEGAAQAQSYPNRPITIVVPFAPGGVADITARPYAVVLSRLVGQPVVVENRAGAGGAVGHAYAARAKPDGYTLMVALSSIVAIPVADEVNGRQPTYRMSDFTPIALLSADPTVLMVPTEAKWKTLKDLIDDAKANPGKISYSSSGIYGTTHTAGEMLAQAAGVKFLHVPYAGGGPAMKAAMANEVMFTIQGPSVAAPHVKSGKFRLLGSWGGKRIPNLPDVPTMKEQGYDAEFYIWAAVFAPHGIPQDVEAKLRQASRQIAQDPEFKKVMENVNTPIDYRDGAEFQAFLEQDSARLAQVIRKMGKTQ